MPARQWQKGWKMQFVLAGFRQSDRTRRYYFDAVDKDWKRTRVTVSADLDLVRKHGISIQELPLLCCGLLEGHPNVAALDFSEAEMAVCADKRAAARAAKDNRPARKRPFSKDPGQAWRGLPPGQAR